MCRRKKNFLASNDFPGDAPDGFRPGAHEQSGLGNDVPGPQGFLEKLRVPAGRGESQRLEGALAAGRVCLVLCSLIVHMLDTGRSNDPGSFLLLVYLVQSIALLMVLRSREVGRRFGAVVHVFDLLWAVILAATIQSANHPFLLFFVFVLFAAAYRWGLREALWSAGAAAILLLVEKLLMAPPPKDLRGFLTSGFDIEGVLVPAAYLLVTGFLLGYLAGVEKELRAETSQAKAMDRALVARELHDGAIQSLIGMEVQVDVLRRQAADQAGPMAAELERIQELLRREVLNLRELMQQMKPLDLSPQRLLDFLAESVDRFWRETGIAASFVSELREVNLPPRVCQELARIAQEALVNVRKHSGARNVVVRFGAPNGNWKLVIDDDGRGFDFAGRYSQAELDAARKGPVIIKERVRSVGGELTIESATGHGARLEITLPKSHD
jgi:signal transduction histidine kinase